MFKKRICTVLRAILAYFEFEDTNTFQTFQMRATKGKLSSTKKKKLLEEHFAINSFKWQHVSDMNLEKSLYANLKSVWDAHEPSSDSTALKTGCY